MHAVVYTFHFGGVIYRFEKGHLRLVRVNENGGKLPSL